MEEYFNQSKDSSDKQQGNEELMDFEVISIPKRTKTQLAIFEDMVKYKNTRILVVDDEEFCISTMKSYLSQLGINVDSQVDFCINGEEAI